MTPLFAAACAGLAAWFSAGALAVTRLPGGEIVRIGLLPPLWALAVLIFVFVAGARLVRLSTSASLPLFCSLLLVLPWFPGHIPPAFLIWTGRVVCWVWAGIALAMLVPVVRPMNWMRDPYLAPRIAATIACAVYIGSAWWISDLLPGGDEPHYLIITQSLLKDRDLQIENNHARRDYLEYFRGQLPPDFLRRGANGQIYSIHAPGLPAVIAPAFALNGYHGVVVFLSIVAAIGGALMWTAAYRFTANAGSAWFSWAAWALTVPFFFQAFSVFPDGLGATVVLFAAIPLLTDLNEISRIRLAWSGIALALLPWLHTRFAIIAAVLGVCIMLRLLQTMEGRRRIVPFLAVPVISGIAWLMFFRVLYGTFSPAAPYNGYTQSSASNILTGLPALFFDQQFGILPYAPVYALGVIGIADLARHRLRLALELSAAVLCYMLSSSAYHMWWGGSSAPARFAVPVLPLLILPAGWFWNSARNAATRTVGFALLAVSIGVTLVVVLVQGGQLAYNFRDGYSRAAEWLSPLVDLPQALPSFFRQATGGATARGFVWIGAILLAWFVLKQLRAKAWLPAGTLTALAVSVMLSTTLIWRMGGTAGPTPETSQLNLLERVNPRVRPTGIQFAGISQVPADTIVSRISISTPQRRPGPPKSILLLAPDVVPAGTYSLVIPHPERAAGTATLVIGRNAKPAMSWNLRTDLRDGAVQLDLPVNVGSLIVEGDDEAAREVGSVSLRPLRVMPSSERLTGDFARRVQRYGRTLAYFFDDAAFVEDPGFWVRGGAGARVAVMPVEPTAALQMFVRNAPVENRVVLDIDGRAQTLTLQPREERTVPVELARGRAALIKIHSDTGFRPSEVDAGSTDTRFLGVWIEFRQ